MATRACKGRTKAGKRCKAAPLKGGEWCSAHDPDTPASARFGSPAQAAEAGAQGGRPRLPRPHELMRERIEAEIDDVLAPYFDALTGAMAHATFEGEIIVSQHPDLGARIAAAEKLLDRVYGRPRQAVEHSGPEGGPLEHVDVPLDDEGLELIRALRGRRAQVRKA